MSVRSGGEARIVRCGYFHRKVKDLTRARDSVRGPVE
jgi:hypothetical protein